MVPLLAGLRVIDVTTVIYGPLVGQILGDLGAEVIKVESLEGDIARRVHPLSPDGMSTMYANNNRNKQCIALDLKTPSGRDVLARMIVGAQVFVHNMRVDAIGRLGFGFDKTKALNPDIIYCAAVGFGRAGRYRERPAFDDVIQAASGLAALPMRRGCDPAYVPGVMADKVAALYAVYGVLAAVAAQARGQVRAIEVEAAMFEALVGFVMNEHLAAASFGGSPETTGYHRMFAHDRRPYRTLDGWVAALPYTEAQWRRLLGWLGRDDVTDAPWFADALERSRRIETLYEVLAEEVARRDTAEWLETLQELDIPHSRVNGLEDLLRDPHLDDVGFFAPNGLEQAGQQRALRQPVRFHGMKEQLDQPAPRLGADGRRIPGRLGFTDAKIDGLIAEGAVGNG